MSRPNHEVITELERLQKAEIVSLQALIDANDAVLEARSASITAQSVHTAALTAYRLAEADAIRRCIIPKETK